MLTMKVVLIGCGFFAQNQLHAWHDIEGADVVAICDIDPVKLKKTGEKFHQRERPLHTTTYVHLRELDSVLGFPTRSDIVALGTSIDTTLEQ